MKVMETNESKLEAFARNLRELREQAGMSQKSLAEKVGVTPTTISAYEKNIKNPSLENALAIADALNVFLGDMCGEVGEVYLRTYGDLLRMIYVVYRAGKGYHFSSKIEVDKKNDTAIIQGMGFDSNTVNHFMKDWRRIAEMRFNNTIDDELVDAWLEKQYRKYDKILLQNTDGSLNDPLPH